MAPLVKRHNAGFNNVGFTLSRPLIQTSVTSCLDSLRYSYRVCDCVPVRRKEDS